MQYYFAPLEGLTDSVYRRLHREYFPGVHRYYTPFLSPTVHRALTPKEARELPFADALDIPVIPQGLSKTSEDFCWLARQCADRGYTEINLNVGCPSGTVTAKGKGAGMLREPDSLDQFLGEIFRDCPLPISVKTRIGFHDTELLPQLLDIYNQYPIKELTVHPRVRGAFYKGDVDMDAFAFCLNNSRAPVCYNGDLRTLADIEQLQKRFPDIPAVMLGRGLIGDPGMLSGGTDRKQLGAFMDALLAEYTEVFGSARNAMFRLKEQWSYIAPNIPGSEKLFKRLRKTTDFKEFKELTHGILAL